LINTKLPSITPEYYECFAPQSAADLHIVYNFISNPITFGFKKDYEKIRIQFSVFDKYSNTSRILDWLAQIEMLFDAQCYPFPDEGQGGIQSNCINKDIETLQYLDEDEMFMGSQDYIFFCQKNKGEDDESSSSDSDSSSSSSTSSITESYSSSSSSTFDQTSSTSSSSSTSLYNCEDEYIGNDFQTYIALNGMTLGFSGYINGRPSYTFSFYAVYYNGIKWIISNAGTPICEETSARDCPYGNFYLVGTTTYEGELMAIP